mgnify:CR=1 FL=1
MGNGFDCRSFYKVYSRKPENLVFLIGYITGGVNSKNRLTLKGITRFL